jgi:hypothetical protein
MSQGGLHSRDVPADHISRILSALNAGVAVVLHGHLRFTADLDLVLALDRDNVLAALEALKGLGFQPRPPVRAEAFAEPEERTRWVREKGMTVFSLWSPTLPGTDVDLFAEEPMPFSELAARALPVRLDKLQVPVASIPDLIALKRRAGRPTDREDIAALERIQLSLKRESKT